MFGFKRRYRADPPRDRRAPRLAAAGGGGDLPPPPNHDALRAADPYTFEVAHRRLAWVTRLLAMGFVASVALNVVQGGTIATMVPLKRIEPALIRIEPVGDRTVKVDPASRVRVLPITKETEGYDLVMEAFARRFTRLLLEIDSTSQADRMREANLYSDGEFWKTFVAEKYPDIKKAAESGLNRSVVIESASKVSERNGVSQYLVAFDQVDERRGQQTEPPKKLHAYLTITSRPHTVRESERFENPLGLRVLGISIKVRGNS